jgi:hypothetical protein
VDRHALEAGGLGELRKPEQRIARLVVADAVEEEQRRSRAGRVASSRSVAAMKASSVR